MDRLERATYWRGHVEAWRQTDLTQIAHCAGQGLNHVITHNPPST